MPFNSRNKESVSLKVTPAITEALSDLERGVAAQLTPEQPVKSNWDLIPWFRKRRIKNATQQRIQLTLEESIEASMKDEINDLITQRLLDYLCVNEIPFSYRNLRIRYGQYAPDDGIRISETTRGSFRIHVIAHEITHHLRHSHGLSLKPSHYDLDEAETEAGNYIGLSQVGIDSSKIAFPFIAGRLLEIKDSSKQLSQSRERILEAGYRLATILKN